MLDVVRDTRYVRTWFKRLPVQRVDQCVIRVARIVDVNRKTEPVEMIC